MKYAVPLNVGTDVMNSAAARELGTQLYVDIHDDAISLRKVQDVAAKHAARENAHLWALESDAPADAGSVGAGAVG